MSLDRDEAHLNAWQQREALAEQILPLCGALYREHAFTDPQKLAERLSAMLRNTALEDLVGSAET